MTWRDRLCQIEVPALEMHMIDRIHKSELVHCKSAEKALPPNKISFLFCFPLDYCFLKPLLSFNQVAKSCNLGSSFLNA